MASPKPPRLFYSSESTRSSARHPVRIPGTCEVGPRPAEDVLVTDISETDCKLLLVSIGVTKAEPVVLALAGEAPVTGRLKWIKQGSVGVAFDVPLDEAMLARLLALEPPSNVVALRRNPAA